MGKIKHGFYGTSIYKRWENIKYRCYNKGYTHYDKYGGRGITVCDEWRNNPLAFIEWALNNGFDPSLQIDRIDNDKGYFPDNCRWVTSFENNINRHLPKSNTSGYRGVILDKKSKKYMVDFCSSKKKYRLIGRFLTPLEAAIAYNNFIINNNLPNKLNIIDHYTPKG